MELSGSELMNFLPAYSGINTVKDDTLFSYYSSLIPDPYTDEFSISTFLKSEFNELKLQPNIPPLDKTRFRPLGQQLFVSRFLSPYTPYNKLLTFHEVGTGKTCLAVLLSETAKKINNKLGKTLVLLRNDLLIKNFKEEMAKTCAREYSPEMFKAGSGELISDLSYTIKLNKSIGQNYDFSTFQVFAKELKGLDDNSIRDMYSNRVIIIDEVHNIKPRDSEIEVYEQFDRLLHLVNNCKILLMSATPMRDKPHESAALFNLLLPKEKRFKLEDFYKDYFNIEEGTFKDDMRDEFKSRIKGLVSYVRATASNVKKIYMGDVIKSWGREDRMRAMRLVRVDMTSIQLEAYKNAYELDRSEDGENDDGAQEEDPNSEDVSGGGGLYKNSRQASLFVAPDGTYGSELLTNNVWFTSGHDKRSTAVFPTERLRRYIYNNEETPSNKTKLERLATLSAKYANIIKVLLYNKEETAFVYSNLVSGSGARVLCGIMTLFDFVHVKVPDKTSGFRLEDYNPDDNKRRFLLISGKYPSSKQTDTLVNKVFSSAQNSKGKYIQVVIASRIANEGMSFKGARQFHNVTPGWNETERTQAQGRIDRAFAHDVFDEADRYMKIYNWCALAKDGDKKFPSIDYHMYSISESKDYPIKQVERLMKEAAVDCALNVKRVQRPGIDSDGSRECDYSKCEFSCDNIPREMYANDNDEEDSDSRKILDTYNIYYGDSKIEEIKDDIKELFGIHFSLHFNQIYEKVIGHNPDLNNLLIVRAIKELIDKCEPIRNKYGIISYLKERDNLYFLVNTSDILDSVNNFLDTTYNRVPILKDKIEFSDFLKVIEDKYFESRLDKVIELAENDDNITAQYIIEKFDIQTQEKLLENCIMAQAMGETKNKKLRDIILDMYKSYIVRNENMILTKFLTELTTKKTRRIIHRCLNISEEDMSKWTWTNCSEKDIGISKKITIEATKKYEKQPYGFYGVSDGSGFKISKILPEDYVMAKGGKEIDMRKKRGGCKCGTDIYNVSGMKYLLITIENIATRRGDISPSLEKYIKDKEIIKNMDKIKNSDKEFLIDEILKGFTLIGGSAKVMKDIPITRYTKEELQELPRERIINIYSYIFATKLGFTAAKLCEVLKDWFKSVDLLYES